MVCHHAYTRTKPLCQSLHHMVMWETLFTHLHTKRRRPPSAKYTGTNTMQSFHGELWNVFENPSVVFLRLLVLIVFYVSVVMLKLYRYWVQHQKSWVSILVVPFISCVTLGKSLFFSSFHLVKHSSPNSVGLWWAESWPPRDFRSQSLGSADVTV